MAKKIVNASLVAGLGVAAGLMVAVPSLDFLTLGNQVYGFVAAAGSAAGVWLMK